MSEAVRYAVVAPAYNEAATIRRLAERLLALGLPLIVVDDGSGDTTADALAGLPLTLLRHERNQGKAATLWHGFERALADGADGVITLDGDGQHDPADIPRLVEAAATYPDSLIIAARRKNIAEAPRARRFANHFADFWVSWASGCRVVDSQSGFRLYPAALLRGVAVPHHPGRGFTFESEVVIEGCRAGFGCRSIPIASRYPAGGRASHFRPVADIAAIVLMVAWKLARWGFYPQGLYRALTGRR